MDSSGNYGYIKAGADSVTPFRTGNATAAKVLSGYTFANASSPNVTGTMPHLTNRATITHASDNQTKVILADEAFTTINSDGVARFELRYNGDSGYIIPNTLLALPYSKVATAIGLTAAKIVKGNTILGLAGTATSVSTVKLVTKTFGAGEPSLNYTTTEAYTVLIAVEHGHTYGGGSLSITGSGVNSLNLINNQMQPETTRVNYCLNAPKGTKVSAYCNGPGGAFIIGIN